MSVVISAVARPTPPNSEATVIANSQLARSAAKMAIALPTMSIPSAAGTVATSPIPASGNEASTARSALPVGLADDAHEAHVARFVAQALERLQELGLVGRREGAQVHRTPVAQGDVALGHARVRAGSGSMTGSVGLRDDLEG